MKEVIQNLHANNNMKTIRERKIDSKRKFQEREKKMKLWSMELQNK